jgi:hypothetical protein
MATTEQRDGEKHKDWFARVGCGNTPITFSWLAGTLDKIDKLVANIAVYNKNFESIADGLVQMNERNKERNAKIAALEAKVAELEARPVGGVQDAGVWKSGTSYAAGDIVTHGGAAWICRSAHVSTGVTPSHDHFRLFVKAGRDAR